MEKFAIDSKESRKLIARHKDIHELDEQYVEKLVDKLLIKLSEALSGHRVLTKYNIYH
jgi:hypothetical protein